MRPAQIDTAQSTEIASAEALGSPTWSTTAQEARSLYRDFGAYGQPHYRWPAAMERLAKQLTSIARTKAPGWDKIAEAALTAESLAVLLVEDPSGYRNYAINPEGLAELVSRFTSIQSAVRELVREEAPGALGAAITSAYGETPYTGQEPMVLGSDAVAARWQEARQEGRSIAADRVAWAAAAAEVRGAYEAFGDTNDGSTDRLAAAIDRLLSIPMPEGDPTALKLLFDVVMTETQCLGPRRFKDEERGDAVVTSARLSDACGWPELTPCVHVAPGNGLSAGLVIIRDAIDRLAGSDADSWVDDPEDAAHLIAAE